MISERTETNNHVFISLQKFRVDYSMRAVLKVFLIVLIFIHLLPGSTSRDIYEKVHPTICLVSFFQNISSDAKIGSFDKIKRHCTGILVNSKGLLILTLE